MAMPLFHSGLSSASAGIVARIRTEVRATMRMACHRHFTMNVPVIP